MPINGRFLFTLLVYSIMTKKNYSTDLCFSLGDSWVQWCLIASVYLLNSEETICSDFKENGLGFVESRHFSEDSVSGEFLCLCVVGFFSLLFRLIDTCPLGRWRNGLVLWMRVLDRKRNENLKIYASS